MNYIIIMHRIETGLKKYIKTQKKISIKHYT